MATDSQSACFPLTFPSLRLSEPPVGSLLAGGTGLLWTQTETRRLTTLPTGIAPGFSELFMAWQTDALALICPVPWLYRSRVLTKAPATGV